MTVTLDQKVRELAALTDEVGVLSVYATTDPREEASGNPAWKVRVKNQLAGIREQVEHEDRDRKMAVRYRLEALEQEFVTLFSASESGIGHALFAPVTGDEVHTVSVQMPLGDTAVLEPTAYIRPLVAAAEDGAPAGVLAVSRDGVRVVDYRYGLASDVTTMSFDLDTEDWRRMRGPGPDNPALAQRSSSQIDRFENRVKDHLGQFLHGLAPRIEELATEQAWQTIVITGDPRFAEVLAKALPANGHRDRDIVQLDHVVESMSASQLAHVVAQDIDASRIRRGQQLAVRARDAAMSGGHGTVGLSDTLGALQDARVSYLLLDEAGQWAGARSSDGRLHPLREAPDGAIPTDLGERMIELAMDSGAKVSLLNPGATGPLDESDGVAALLRW